MSRSRNWLKISCIGCVGAPCLALLLGAGIVKCQADRIGNQLPVELAKLKSMGIATEPEELLPNPPIPDAENAAEHYKKIFAAADKAAGLGKSTDATLLSNYTGHPSDTASYEAVLKRYQPVFDLAAELPEFKKYAPKRKYEDGFDLLFPEFSKMKELVKRESSRTRYLLDKGRKREALQAIEVQYAVSDHLAMEPSLIGALVCIAINAIANVNLDIFLESIQNDGALLAETEKMLQRHTAIPDFRRVMEGELILSRTSFEKIKSGEDLSALLGQDSGPMTVDTAIDRVTLGNESFRRMFQAKQVEAYRRMFEMLPKDRTDWVAINESMKKFSAQIEADTSVANRMNQIMFPVFDQATIAFAKMEAQNRVALLAVKLLRMRPLGLPRDLSAFGRLAIDPLVGKPMGYVRKGDGFKVWSVGQDLHDDGGRKRAPGLSANDTDFVMGYRIGFPSPTRKAVSLPAGSPGAVPGALGP